MKKISNVMLFVFTFILSYIFISSIFRIKLHAPPLEYFIETMKHMVVFKTIVSFIICGVVFLVSKLYKMFKINKA